MGLGMIVPSPLPRKPLTDLEQVGVSSRLRFDSLSDDERDAFEGWYDRMLARRTEDNGQPVR